jgi:hypothetical protein
MADVDWLEEIRPRVHLLARPDVSRYTGDEERLMSVMSESSSVSSLNKRDDQRPSKTNCSCRDGPM